MSDALERVIAEQQKEIDRLRSMEKHNAEAWQRENRAVERVAQAAFNVLNHPNNRETHIELREAVMAMGFCPICGWRPCECEGRYGD
jgi:ferric-dicitrate binding protein FerR (iron transport regulator)